MSLCQCIGWFENFAIDDDRYVVAIEISNFELKTRLTVWPASLVNKHPPSRFHDASWRSIQIMKI
jgi:hypothetical protein